MAAAQGRNAVGVGIRVLILMVIAGAASAQIGTDITGLNLCGYGDCEARGTYVADPFGFTNPATMPVGSLYYARRGVFLGGSYFRLKTGGVGADIASGSVAVAAAPWVFQVFGLYADGHGTAKSLPDAELVLRTRMLKLAAAVDLGGLSSKLKGFSAGLMFGVPGTDGEMRVSLFEQTLVEARSKQGLSLFPGLHWRGGERDWLALGAMLNVEQHRQKITGIDPMTFRPFRDRGTSNAWFPRSGLSALPFIPLGMAGPDTALGRYLSEFRTAIDIEYRNISAMGEPTRRQTTGYFGLDTRLVPDDVNPLSDFLLLHLLGGADTRSGWGAGVGLYGNGPLQMLSCNPTYSSRPLMKSIGDRANMWSFTCAVAATF